MRNLLFALAFAILGNTGATAQDWPARPIRLMVPFPPGGGSDILARIMGRWLSERLAQPVVVENKPGGNTNVSVQAVVNSPADGYTLLFLGSSAAINATLYPTLPFSVARDLAPVAGLSRSPMVVEVNPSVPAKSVAELIAMPGLIPAGSPWLRMAPARSPIWRASCSR
jgi:tripartite-type tricarboxylate transporter receptor subunit TctC